MSTYTTTRIVAQAAAAIDYDAFKLNIVKEKMPAATSAHALCEIVDIRPVDGGTKTAIDVRVIAP